jgi:hypothetical protein
MNDTDGPVYPDPRSRDDSIYIQSSKELLYTPFITILLLLLLHLVNNSVLVLCCYHLRGHVIRPLRIPVKVSPLLPQHCPDGLRRLRWPGVHRNFAPLNASSTSAIVILCFKTPWGNHREERLHRAATFGVYSSH